MDQITEADRERLVEVFKAFEHRFDDWYVATHPNAVRRKHGYHLDHLDADDCEAVFTETFSGEQDRIYMPFDAVIGTTEEMIERIKRRREEEEVARQRKREEEEAARRQRVAAERARQAEAAARKEQHDRERIFREECAKRGIDPDGGNA